MSIDELSGPDALRLFYSSVFPFERMYQWLSYNDASRTTFSRREFSFTLENDIYMRFQSFSSCAEMKEKMIKLNPIKIDIGAVYSARPSEKKSLQGATFRPLEKEMVIDIDMTDYDDVRTCCQDKGICKKCWRFIVVAVQILHKLLSEDFGFKNCLWVYSGRRGVHCWIADERARKMDLSARKAMVTYLELIKGGPEVKKKVILSGDLLHPMVNKALAVVEPVFSKRIIFEQDVLTSDDKIKKFLALVPDENLRDAFYKSWTPNTKIKERWDQFCGELEKHLSTRRVASKFSMKHLKDEIMLQYCYPRLDVNVSIQLNHLLKSPFCIHPSTDRLCVPFRAEEVDSFDPEAVPKLKDILKDVYDTSCGSLNTSSSNAGALLETPYRIFDDFLASLQVAHNQRQKNSRMDEDSKMIY